MRKIILASQSPQRKLLMQALGIPFDVMPANIDERSIVEDDQKLRAKLIAKAKADWVANSVSSSDPDNNSQSIIIAADTFTLFNDKAYEKPESNEQAIQMLKEQSGQTGFCYSGFAYIDKKNKVKKVNCETREASLGCGEAREGALGYNIEISEVAITEILFRKLSNFEIQKYVDENPVMTWSAAFCPAYSAGANLIASTNGSFTSFTHGLPMEILVPLLEKSGVFNEAK